MEHTDIHKICDHENRGFFELKSVFDSMVVVAFQITFCAEMYANDFFYFLKIIFDISTSKQFKTYKSY